MPTFLDLVNKLRQAQASRPLETVSPDPNYSSILIRPTFPQPTTTPIIRPRGPYSEYERLVDVGRRIAADPTLNEKGETINRPGRFRSGLLQLLNGVGQAARNNVAAGRTDWSDLAGVAGAGAAGLGVGVADPGLIVKSLHQQAVERNRQAQADELGRITGLARVKGIEAEAARDEAYAAANTPEAIQAKANAKKAIDEAENFTAAMKELDDIAQKGADNDYLQARASEIETRFGKKVLVPKYKAKAEGGFSLPPGGIRYDSQGNPIVHNTNPTPGQLENLSQNTDNIGKANADKQQILGEIEAATQSVLQRQKEVENLEATKPKWDQAQADSEDIGPDYVKNYNKNIDDWQRRRDRAQQNWENAVAAQKNAENRLSGSYVPQPRSIPTPANLTPQTFTMKEIEKRAKAAGQTVEAYKARVLELYPNAKITY